MWWSSRRGAVFAVARGREGVGPASLAQGTRASPALGTPGRQPAAILRSVSRTGAWCRGLADAARPVATAPYAPAEAAALLGLAGVIESVGRAAFTDVSAQFVVVLCLLALATTVPVALRNPAGSALAVSAATVVSLGFFHILTVAGLVAELFVLYRLGRSGSPLSGSPPRRPGVLAPVLTVPFLVLALAGPRPTESGAAFLTVVLAALAPVAAWAGIAGRARHEAAESRVAQEAISGALFEQTARAERVRIAHELHDVVAHHISMVAVQAETARLTTPGMPAAGAQRLSAIGDSARAALTEMRLLLGVLREDTDQDVPDRQPQPGIGQLNDLLDEARAASGTGTRLIVRGSPVALDPGVELAAYRIVREALTNARRHAPGAAVDVELHYGDDALRLRIRDNGPGSDLQVPVAGHGLPGMEARASAVGGELRSGPAAIGGFVVEATLPATVGALR